MKASVNGFQSGQVAAALTADSKNSRLQFSLPKWTSCCGTHCGWQEVSNPLFKFNFQFQNGTSATALTAVSKNSHFKFQFSISFSFLNLLLNSQYLCTQGTISRMYILHSLHFSSITIWATSKVALVSTRLRTIV